MKILIFFFIKLPRKIFHAIFYKAEHLYYQFFYSKPKLEAVITPERYLLFGKEHSGNPADIYHGLFSADKIKEKIKEADLVCGHLFDLLGSGAKKLSPDGRGYQPIDWHSDFKSGYRWNPETFYHNIRYGEKEGVDIKVPRELSRFQHLNILGQAYILTGNKKYSEEFANQIDDWIKSNPIGFGVNWACTMDVAIRAVNWLAAMEYFADKNLFSQDFLKMFYTSIYEHGRFIRSHLENSSRWTTNHYLADIAGLFFISIYCSFFKEAKEWHEFTLQELHREMEKQVYSDGCSFEASTSYHRLALEMFFYSELLAERAGINFTESYKNKLKKMFEFSLYCIKPNGMIPQIGDNDNGRFLKFSERPVLEHKYLLSLATIYFKDANFKLKQSDVDEEAFWVFGERSKTVWDNLSLKESLSGFKSFSDAGWYIIRHNNNYCFISCAPRRQEAPNGHLHNDRLSFELMLDGQDIIVDPGTYVYTPYPRERNKFRSTEYHNTVKFDGYEQNEMSNRDVFTLVNRVDVINALLTEEGDRVVFKGEIHYADIMHRRTIILDKKTSDWQITDSLSCSNPVNAKLLFHLSSNLTNNGNSLLSKKTGNKIALVEIEGYTLESGEYDYSPEYGVKVRAEYLSVNIPKAKSEKALVTNIKRERQYLQRCAGL